MSYPALTVPNSEMRILESAIVGDSYQLNIVLPAGYAQSNLQYPVVYAADGNETTFTLFQITNSLVKTQELPPVIVVGIGYPFEDPAEIFVRRSRDYNPTPDEDHDRRYMQQFNLDSIQTDGADKFLRFIREELKPFINDTYRTDPTGNTYVGHSGGGLFGLHTLFNHPVTFGRYVIVSPTIFRSDRAILQDERSYAETHDDLSARVFLSVGGREETDDPIADPFEDDLLASLKLVTNLKRMGALLQERNYPSLVLSTHVFPDETHLSVLPAAFSRGLREVFK